MTAQPESLVRQYYDALDTHAYDRLESLLVPSFVQRRPDRTFDRRDEFVAFMRDERPNPDTRHEIGAIVADGDRAAARGRVVDEGTDRRLFEFADFFEIEDGRIVRLETYSR